MGIKYRKTPLVVEAVQWNPKPNDVRFTFPDGTAFRVKNVFPPWRKELEIPTREGVMRASEGDWIIKGIKGEFYPCKPDIFDATYEKVEDKPKEQP